MIAALFAQLPQAAVPAAQDPAARALELHGSLALRYRTRWSGHDSDQDLAETLALELGDAARDPLTASLSAEARLDLDGVARRTNSSAFLQLEDTYAGAFAARLYHACVDVHSAGGWETLRAGRQTIVETPETAWFDGVRAETRELGGARARFGAYGGVPVQLESGVPAGDALYGSFAEVRPWSGGRVRADWMHAEDDARLGPRSDDLLGFGIWQSLWTSLRLEGQYTRLEQRDRDLRLRASWSASDSDLVLRASWYRLLEPQGDLALPLDPFAATLHELEPYEQYGLQLSKSLTRHLQLQAGYDARRVERAQDVGAFNHDYDRASATLGATGMLPWALDASLTGEVWDSQQSRLRTFGAELARRFDERLDACVGSFYSLYEYDLYQARELDHVRTWYLKLVLDRSAPFRVELRYEFEEDPIDRYHDLRLGATWRF
jgi:hypothetical protein